ncbi:helix-turn-helix domain-containing protein [Enterococcus sp. LJL90]
MEVGKKLQQFVKRFHYLSPQNLPYIQGAGRSQGHANYFWDGAARKDQLVVLQLTLAGEGQLNSGGKDIPQRPGDFFVAAIPGKFSYSGTDWQFAYLEFAPIFRQWLTAPTQIGQGASPAFQKRLLNLVDSLATADLSLHENAKLAFDFFLDLLAELERLQQARSPEAEQIKKYLEEHFQEDFGLDDLAELFAKSKYQIIHLFEAAYTITPMAYLRKFRILKALELLGEKKNLQELAEAVGFSDGNYFGKLFKAELGLTPTEYKLSKGYH